MGHNSRLSGVVAFSSTATVVTSTLVSEMGGSSKSNSLSLLGSIVGNLSYLDIAKVAKAPRVEAGWPQQPAFRPELERLQVAGSTGTSVLVRPLSLM